MRFAISEFDNDYRTWTAFHEIREFPSQKEADEYCRNESWTGHTYRAKEITRI